VLCVCVCMCRPVCVCDHVLQVTVDQFPFHTPGSLFVAVWPTLPSLLIYSWSCVSHCLNSHSVWYWLYRYHCQKEQRVGVSRKSSNWRSHFIPTNPLSVTFLPSPSTSGQDEVKVATRGGCQWHLGDLLAARVHYNPATCYLNLSLQ